MKRRYGAIAIILMLGAAALIIASAATDRDGGTAPVHAQDQVAAGNRGYTPSLDIGRSRGPRNPRLGILDKPAPSLTVDHWFNLPDGRESLDIADYRGKVVYFYGFQSWCPGCHSHGFPTLQELIRRFEGEDDVAFVAVQTTFEGFHTNTAANALKTAQRYDLDVPVGHSGSEGRRSELMRDYRTGGTPWTVIIDGNGIVRFNDFRIRPDEAETLIDQLLAKKEP